MTPDSEPELFKHFAPDSIWARAAFQPTYDPLDVVTSVYSVATKQATIVPFQPFVTQAKLAAGLGLRNVVLKPRQVGSTTMLLSLLHACAWTTPNLNILVMSHLEQTTARIRETCKNWVTWLNETVDAKIRIGTDNAEELEFTDMNSRIYFATSGTKGAGRSSTLHAVLLTEVAFWQGGEYGAILESVPDNGIVFTESTPNGPGNTFHTLYREKSSYVKHFFPWWIEPSRSLPYGDNEMVFTEDEAVLVAKHGLTKDQIAWRRWKIADMKANGSKVPFEQEYPEDDVACFMASIKSAIPAKLVVRIMEQARYNPPVRTVDVHGDAWDPGGEMRVWIPPQAGHHYVVTCDVGGGHSDGDRSVAIVRDVDAGKRHVATLAGWWTPTKFADLTCELATWYNKGYLSHERNGIGNEAVKQASERVGYANYHWSDRKGKDGEYRAGFYVNPEQRTPLLTGVVQEVVAQDFLSFDEELIDEMSGMRIERGRAASGWSDTIVFGANSHDDYVMAYAQGTEIMRTLVIINDVARPIQAL